jgi:hypothetical protein
LIGKPEGKRPLGRPRRRWEDNIRMNLEEIKWEAVWTGFTCRRIEITDGILSTWY